ncbi:MAG: SDR family NAD(P)-dependent oxidoreductase, partial [Thermoguttaceae bacterium]|nr:SDR family NAD(P)-dependent oxidoreductase [Thermoguttaceae bacterium]
MEFENKVALVTGAAGSIGMAVAARMVAEGARAFVTDLDSQRVDAVARRLGPACRGLAADVTRADQVADVVRAALDAFGG